MNYTIHDLDEYVEYISLIKDRIIRKVAHLTEDVRKVVEEIANDTEIEMLTEIPKLPKRSITIERKFMQKFLSLIKEVIKTETEYISTLIITFGDELLNYGLILDILNEFSYVFPEIPDIVLNILLKNGVILKSELKEIEAQTKKYSRSESDEIALKLLAINYLMVYGTLPPDIISNAGKYITELFYSHIGIVLKGLTVYNMLRVTIQSTIHVIPFIIREILSHEDQYLINKLYNLAYKDKNTIECIKILAKYQIISEKDKVELLNLYYYLTRYIRRKRIIRVCSNIVESYIKDRVIDIISTLTKRMAIPIIEKYRRGEEVEQIEELARDIYTYNTLENTLHIIDTNILKIYKLSKSLRVIKVSKYNPEVYEFEYPLKKYIPLTILYDVVKYYVFELRTVKREDELKAYAQTFDKDYVNKIYAFAYTTGLISHDVEVAESYIDYIYNNFKNTTIYNGERILSKIIKYIRNNNIYGVKY